MKIQRIAAFAVISLVWGSMWLIPQAPPAPGSLLRSSALVFALSAALLAIVAVGSRRPRPRLQEWRANAILGASLVAVPYLLMVWVTPHLSPGITAVILAGTPLVAGFFCDAPWMARNASIAGLGGVALVVGGILSVSLRQLPWAAVLFAGVAITAASLAFAQKHLSAASPVFSAAIQLAMASVILAAAGYAERIPAGGAGGSLPRIAVLLLVVGHGVAYPLYFWLLQRLRVDQLAATVWAQLLVAVAESVWLLRPRVGWQILLGMAVVAGSIFALARSGRDSQMLTVRVTSLTG
jgi:drug/metabolite transporter (DMT)-like permease